MFEGTVPIIFKFASSRRKNLTPSEMILWGNLKNGIKGYKFRRQHPIGKYIADFYCHKLRLVIEVDGNIHNIPDVKANDLQRERNLQALGCRIIRFTNLDVLERLQIVLDKIYFLVDDDLGKSV